MKGKIFKILGIAVIIALLFIIIMQVLYIARKHALEDKVAKIVQNQVKDEKETKSDIMLLNIEEYEQNKEKYDQIERALKKDEYLKDENGSYLYDENGEKIRNPETIILDEMGYYSQKK